MKQISLFSQKYTITCILLVLCSFLSSGCCSNKQLPKETSTHQQNDSTSTTIHERVITMHDTVLVYIPVESTSSVGQQNSHLETSVATSDAYVDSTGVLHHTLDNKAQEIQAPIDIHVPVVDTSHYEIHNTVDSVYVPQPYPVEKLVEKPLSWFQKTLMYIGVLALLAIIGYIVFWIIKKRFLP